MIHMPLFRVLIFIISYNAEAFIEKVLDRIPVGVWENDDYQVEVLVIDDQSSDSTFYRANSFRQAHPTLHIQVLYNPVNQGYGGNQKLGYHYALQQGFDAIVLLHGDGQYAPEYLDQMIRPLLKDEADVVLGSRMIRRLDALRGKMPLYKWIGNQVLTFIQNKLLGSSLSEFHTGYRAFLTQALRRIPFEYNANGFDFDTDVLIQLLDTGQRILEISVPTYYDDEISHVNGISYAMDILRTTMRSRIVRLNLLYDRRFDYWQQQETYTLKLGYPSSHEFALEHTIPDATILDLGCGPGYMAQALAQKGARIISLDRRITQLTRQHSIHTIETDIERIDWAQIQFQVDLVFMLDIIEHLHNPEEFMLQARDHLAREKSPRFLITTGNVAFFIVRFSLAVGLLNYGKKGILDQDHKRLFTFASLRRLLESTGYEILEVRGIPAPYPLAIGDNFLAHLLILLNRLLICISSGLFSYQIAFVAQPRPMVSYLLASAQVASRQKVQDLEESGTT
ncbi:MAG: hypothetical protein A2W33_08370 [Chloroflexi bacterium RBG_16_52_11]|nr:MAG: hypothetical protein A2W33_08370 [Chloroflexi bacterium RBG_16_52_11]